MIKVMIVEDEMIERKALMFLLAQYYKKTVEVIYQAADGKEAIEKAPVLKPDVILMDIHMPKMDGLEASSHIKARMSDVEIIILTAFGYFEYAQKAIQVGVVDYLVKPFSNKKFCETLDIIIEKIIKKRKSLEEQMKIYNKLQKLGQLVEKEIVIGMAYGTHLSTKQIKEYKGYLNIKSDYFVCVVFQVDTDVSLDDNITAFIKNKFRFIFSEVVGYNFFNAIILFLFKNQLDKVISSKAFSDTKNDIQSYLAYNCSIRGHVGISEVYTSMSNMHRAYIEAKKAIEEDCQIDNQKNPERFKKTQYLYQKEIKLCEKMINEDSEGAREQLKKIICSLLENHCENNFEEIKDYAEQLCTIIDRNLVQFFGDNIRMINIRRVHEQIRDLNRIEDISLYLDKLVHEIILFIMTHKQGRNKKMIDIVKDYIHEHYSKDISLKDIADHVCLSSYYLSKCFKNTEGINYKDYLIKVRMEKAKHLMSKQNKTVQETAFEVGYSDPNYFSKAFKNYVGISPTQYRDKYVE